MRRQPLQLLADVRLVRNQRRLLQQPLRLDRGISQQLAEAALQSLLELWNQVADRLFQLRGLGFNRFGAGAYVGRDRGPLLAPFRVELLQRVFQRLGQQGVQPCSQLFVALLGLGQHSGNPQHRRQIGLLRNSVRLR